MLDDARLIKNFVSDGLILTQRKAFKKILDLCLQREGAHSPQLETGDLHQKIIFSALHYKSALTNAINIYMNSGAFSALFGEQFIVNTCQNIYPGEDPDYLVISEKNFRIDLPNKFALEKKRFSLGWHQESGYYDNYVSHQDGWVIWLTLFACKREQGALLCLDGSSSLGALQHEKVVLDKANNKNIRMLVPEKVIEKYNHKPTCYEVLNSGDCAAFHFNTIHASGTNSDDQYVRMTVQARVSLAKSKHFLV